MNLRHLALGSIIALLGVTLVGCNGRPVAPAAGSTTEKFLGTWSGLIPNTGAGQSLVTGDKYTVEFSHTAPKGQPDSAAGLWATITHSSVTTPLGGELLDAAHSSDKDIVFTQNLSVKGLEASGLRSLAGKTYGNLVRFRIDSSNPDLLHYTIDGESFSVDLKRVGK